MSTFHQQVDDETAEALQTLREVVDHCERASLDDAASTLRALAGRLTGLKGVDDASYHQRVGEVSAAGFRALNDVADACDDAGLVVDASLLRGVAKRLQRLVYDAMTETQPIDLPKPKS